MFVRLDLGCNPDLTSDVNRPESLVKSPVMFTLCAWTLRCRSMPELETDLAGDFDRKSGTPLFGSGGPIPGDRDSDSCHSVMCTSPPDPGGDDIIMTLLQSLLSGSGKFMPHVFVGKFAPEVRAGS